jgi:deoxyribodipyrimidine photolyase
LDADLESDILGWQYISGSLQDAHELERLDNPEACRNIMFIEAFAFAIELYVYCSNFPDEAC